MTTPRNPLPPPAPRDPLARPQLHPVAPGARSRAMQAMAARAAQGRFVLQACTVCGTATYPPRDACPRCWGTLAWHDQPTGGRVLANTVIRVSTDPYFRDRLPWHMGSIQLDAGPVVLAHLARGLEPGARVTMRLMLDRGGNAALFALPSDAAHPPQPEQGATIMSADPQGRTFVVPVAGATVLVSDARQPVGRALVGALAAAGARLVVAGLPGPAPMRDAHDPVLGLPGVQPLPLDVTDPVSVAETISRIGGPLDIVINTARHVRAGGVSHDGNLLGHHRALEVSAMGLARLAQATAPILAGRPSGAFLDVLSVKALAGDAGHAGFAAAEAARLSLLQSFRHEMRSTGVRVLEVFTGPTDDADHQALPPPKVAPARLAAAVLDALAQGREQTCVGEVAREAMRRWLDDPALFARETQP
ncbi:SDR family oxidoreductase [Novosphingobium capsulatum]|uniref:SDR family oxidoreductase n=1 Tax=Novosphingobium capsulatum TaxID=13688 RepID=UPI00078893B1|nr:SDR family oxidoreductase [Novosphingobium capsulatum]WQD94758.1 SDR family oxidoreductase [Novosphingobium capsulatum]